MKFIPIPGAELYYDPRFLSQEEASRLLNELMGRRAWERRKGSFGHTVPRDEAFGELIMYSGKAEGSASDHRVPEAQNDPGRFS